MVLEKDPDTANAGQSDPLSRICERWWDIVAIATTLQREQTHGRGTSSTPTTTPAAILPDSVAPSATVHFPVSTTAAASSPTGALVSASASAAVASTPMFQAILSGDSRILWPAEQTSVPPPPPPVLDEMRRALHAVRKDEELEATQVKVILGSMSGTLLRDVTLVQAYFQRPRSLEPDQTVKKMLYLSLPSMRTWGSCRGTPAHGVVDTCTDGH
eukprot:2245412-Pleurochrysis_carterae.AAC.1